MRGEQFISSIPRIGSHSSKLAKLAVQLFPGHCLKPLADALKHPDARAGLRQRALFDGQQGDRSWSSRLGSEWLSCIRGHPIEVILRSGRPKRGRKGFLETRDRRIVFADAIVRKAFDCSLSNKPAGKRIGGAPNARGSEKFEDLDPHLNELVTQFVRVWIDGPQIFG